MKRRIWPKYVIDIVNLNRFWIKPDYHRGQKHLGPGLSAETVSPDSLGRAAYIDEEERQFQQFWHFRFGLFLHFQRISFGARDQLEALCDAGLDVILNHLASEAVP